MEEVKNKFSACKQFFIMEIEARVVAATLEILELSQIDGKPQEIMPANLEEATPSTKKEFLKELSFSIVDKFILHEDQVNNLIAQLEKEKSSSETSNGRFPCRYSGCPKTFVHDGKRRITHEKTHGLYAETSGTYFTINDTTSISTQRDDMFNYQHAPLEYGMLFLNFCDAVSEGDGQRIIRFWKFFLLFLKNDGQRSCKYALECLTIMCQIYALLSPNDAHRLIWNRSVKAKYGLGGNIPLDLALKHYNRVLKEVIKKMGPNASNEKAVNRFCRSFVVTKQLMDNFDQDCKLFKRSSHHVKKRATEDLEKIVNELLTCDAFSEHSNRKYKKFANIAPSVLDKFDLKSMFKWINQHKLSIYLHKTAR